MPRRTERPEADLRDEAPRDRARDWPATAIVAMVAARFRRRRPEHALRVERNERDEPDHRSARERRQRARRREHALREELEREDRLLCARLDEEERPVSM